MWDLLIELKTRSSALFHFGLICFVLGIVCLLLVKMTSTQVYGVNAWFKPAKFAFSTCSYAWAMAWYCHYLPKFNVGLFSIAVIVLLGFEILYIALQAARGMESHYNISTPIYSMLYSAMALAATLVTLYTFYIGVLFFIGDFSHLPSAYLWGIRLGILVFVVFSFQGFAMGSKLNHSVGAVNVNSNLFLIGWSKTVGDLRVAHFIGMHALQVLPILSFYVFKSTKSIILISILYTLLAAFSFFQALSGKPFTSINFSKNEINR